MNPTGLRHSSPTVEKSEIEKVLALRESRKALADRLQLIEAALSESENEIIAQIDAGADLSQTGYAISINESERRFPRWKEEFISIAGKPAADRVLEATPATVYRRLVVK